MDLVSVTEARTINTRPHQVRIFVRFLARNAAFAVIYTSDYERKTAFCAFSFTDALIQTD